MIIKFTQWLDKREFFRYRLWEFSYRNLLRFFPYHFLFKIILRHPVLALCGVMKYRKLVKEAKGVDLSGTNKLDDIFVQLKTGMIDARGFVIAPGFCMKPYNENKSKSPCPVGHFNHRCLVLERSSMLSKNQQYWQQPCNNCNLGTFAVLS